VRRNPRRLRIAVVAGFFVLLFAVGIARVVDLCVVDAPELRRLAQRQYERKVSLPPHRGSIVDRNGDVLALTVGSASVYARPRAGAVSQKDVTRVAEILELEPREVRRKLSSRSPFVWLRRNATMAQAERVGELGLAAIMSEPSRRRVYPRGPLAAHLIGFAGVDLQGLEGVEFAYDRYLRGNFSSLRAKVDARGRRRFTEGTGTEHDSRGARVELTIDATLQAAVDEQLEAAVRWRQADAGIAVVMDPATGEVLALSTAPRFDPNEHTAFSPQSWRNRAVSDSHEPGSTFKGIVAAIAMEAGVVRQDERIFCEEGRYRVGKHVIRDVHPSEWLTFSEVIKESSNICSAKIGERLGGERMAQAIKKFGFGSRTGIDLPGEATGLVRDGSTWRRINVVTASFGQGIAVTPLQLTTAYAALANGGRLMRPYVVRRVVAASGEVLHENRPEVVGRPISARTAAMVTKMLRGVVDGGTGRAASVEGLAVAGKTGTAQKVEPGTGRYSEDARVASFVGFLPAEAPRFVILVVVDHPRTATYGGVVAGPVFRGIAEFAADRAGLRAASVVPQASPRLAPKAQLVQWSMQETRRGMPSFLGMSMRAALTEAARAGWHVETRGSGFVVRQEPAPGAPAVPGGRVVLAFGSAPG
jgi:cell division protein FtsI (penicillin-binding protein 3)